MAQQSPAQSEQSEQPGQSDTVVVMAPQCPAKSDTVIHETTRRVLVDIVVTDEKGNPVRGLKKDDFIVKEDSQTQQIVSFDSANGSAPAFVPPKLPQLPPNTYVDLPSEPERGPLYVLYYDMVNTQPEDQMSFYPEFMEFIDKAPSGTRFALFGNMAGLHLIQGFTSDREALRAAVLYRGPGPHLPNVFVNGGMYGRGDTGAALSNLQFLAQYLEGIPGRKNLIWLSSSFPIPVGPAGKSWTFVDTDMIQQTFAAMMRSEIAIYPIDLKGLEVRNLRNPWDPAEYIADSTGGHAWIAENRVHLALQEVVERSQTCYTLSYLPSNDKYDGTLRKIEVKLQKGNKTYNLAYRQFYYAAAEGAELSNVKPGSLDARFLAAKAEDTLNALIERGAPMVHDLIFRVHLGVAGVPAMATPEQMAGIQTEPAYFRTGRKNAAPKPVAPVKLQKYQIDYTVLDPQLKINAERTGKPPAFEFVAVAYDADGRMMNGISNEGLAALPSRTDGKKVTTFGVQQEFYVPPGAFWIRMAVRDKTTGRMGTLEVPLPLKAEPVRQASN